MRTPNELFDLRGRTALVTGGNRGLGKTMAGALAGAGAKVMIAASSAAGTERAREAFAAEGIEVLTGAADLADRRQTEELGAHAVATLGQVDILVANAGIGIMEPADAFSDAAMQQALEINLIAPMLLTRALVPEMKRRRWGRLIYVSSVAASASNTVGHGVYSATKAGLEAYARTAAIELGAFGITANSIAPGAFATDMAETGLGAYNEATRATYDSLTKMTALERWGEPSELEGAVLLLASDAGSYVTGTTLVVDGGFCVRSTPATRGPE